MDDLEEEGKGKTAEELYSLLSVIFKMAMLHRLIDYNPLDIVIHTKHESQHGVALTKEEEKTLITKTNDVILRGALALGLYTGMRPNEYKTAKIEGKFIVAVNSKRKNGKVEYKKIPITKMLEPYLAFFHSSAPFPLHYPQKFLCVVYIQPYFLVDNNLPNDFD